MFWLVSIIVGFDSPRLGAFSLNFTKVYYLRNDLGNVTKLLGTRTIPSVVRLFAYLSHENTTVNKPCSNLNVFCEFISPNYEQTVTCDSEFSKKDPKTFPYEELNTFEKKSAKNCF
jgi:hypothetical protein